MIQLTKYGFRTSYDIDDMLYDDMTWLAEQTTGSFKSFRKVVEVMVLSDNHVDEFWEIVSKKRYENDMRKREKAREIPVIINGEEGLFTKEEFEVAKQILGIPEKISNCCGADVTESNDYTARCFDCKENCGVVYHFGE